MKNSIVITLVLLISLSSFSQQRKKYVGAWTYHSKNTDIIGLSLGVAPKDLLGDTTLTRTYGMKLEAPGLGILYPIAPKSYLSGGPNDDDLLEKVYGINFSGGSLGEITVHGISGAFIGQYLQVMNGIAIGGIANSIEEQNGISIALLGNEVYHGLGASIALSGNYAYSYLGVQIGAFNDIERFGRGMQLGIFNTSNDYKGIQIGLSNHDTTTHSKYEGIQIGILNKADNFRGIQIGLWNKNERRSLPFINWQFSKKKVKTKTS
ncbi:hypothetical protein D1815_21655 [Aquimarina sp. AD1]|uniref:LA_2272 family surface repeat-containing protein n=1 Tax=Aquimarina sp. (strain AD1) TaxID=1714848 RepID=UPI000E53A61D|nr:hypothetical protein [Aquimarina sp. AD1]AXT58241.1 hypothetical protein D1815_21655 [Aquimarina sp. AD1]RKN09514.1 hypothetical protein D7035_19825 [Aquimarina sp. AD1]